MCSVRTNLDIIILRAVDSAAECLPGMIRLLPTPGNRVSTSTQLHPEPAT